MRSIQRVLLILLSLLAASLNGQAPEPDSAEPLEPAKYGDLLKRLQAGDTTVNLDELRLVYAQSGNYKPYRNDIKETQSKMRMALKHGNFEQAMAAAKSILKKEFMNLEAHRVCAISYDSLGDTSKTRFHEWMFLGSLKTILSSGDGKSRSSAYHVLTVDEEYVVLDVLGLEPELQALDRSDDGSAYDRFEVVNKSTEEKQEVFFNISVMMVKLDKKYR